MKPVLLLIAGPNGSGKTTVTVSLRRDQWSEGVEYINPDDIAKEKFGDWNSRDAILNMVLISSILGNGSLRKKLPLYFWCSGRG